MGYQTIEVRKPTPSIGAEIFGVDLAKPLGNQTFQEIHDALMANLVIFFRDQELDHEQHKAFGRRFGELHLHPTSTRGGERLGGLAKRSRLGRELAAVLLEGGGNRRGELGGVGPSGCAQDKMVAHGRFLA